MEVGRRNRVPLRRQPRVAHEAPHKKSREPKLAGLDFKSDRRRQVSAARDQKVKRAPTVGAQFEAAAKPDCKPPSTTEYITPP